MTLSGSKVTSLYACRGARDDNRPVSKVDREDVFNLLKALNNLVRKAVSTALGDIRLKGLHLFTWFFCFSPSANAHLAFTVSFVVKDLSITFGS